MHIRIKQTFVLSGRGLNVTVLKVMQLNVPHALAVVCSFPQAPGSSPKDNVCQCNKTYGSKATLSSELVDRSSQSPMLL